MPNYVTFKEINFKLLTLLNNTVPIGCVVVSFESFLPPHAHMNETEFLKTSETEDEGAAGWADQPLTVHVMQKKWRFYIFCFLFYLLLFFVPQHFEHFIKLKELF